MDPNSDVYTNSSLDDTLGISTYFFSFASRLAEEAGLGRFPPRVARSAKLLWVKLPLVFKGSSIGLLSTGFEIKTLS